ncbi:MAG: SRPBCC family protein [Chlorobiaceae bacterium]|jgi:carbon monoxide dehydrogenase subunit G|nr:SRPBCC family protein [Chlorobiaceae bacterium]
MAFTVDIALTRDMAVPESPDGVFSLLADVPRSASHFPSVDRLADLGGNAFRWEMQKIGIGGYTLQQTVYACRYKADEAAGIVSWVPVDGVGNAAVSGEWIVRPDGAGTALTLNTRGVLSVDFPSFLQFMLSPLIVMEFTGMVDRYIENLNKTFSVG